LSDDTHEQDESPTVAEAGPATLVRGARNDTDDGEIERTRVVDPSSSRDSSPSISRGPEAPPTQVGRFRIVRCIGSGGMGVVYAAHDDELDRDVAIKILRSGLAVGISGRERLLREAQAIAKLSHPNTVHVYEVGHDGERVFMAMELVRGPTLRQWCRAEERTWSEIVDALLGAGEGLAAAHAESIVHRDFKPDNVIVADDGRPRVVDFGLARAHGSASTDGEPPAQEDEPASSGKSGSDHGLLPMGLTATGIVVGTPAYMAPEQIAKGDPDARTDQFAFCVSLFEMLYGKRPFSGSTYTALVKSIQRGTPIEVDSSARGIPRSVHAVVMRGLSPRPSDRFASMRDLLDALKAARSPPPRRLAALAIMAVAAAAIVGLLASRDPVITTEPTPPSASETSPDPWAEIVAASDLPEPIAAALEGDPTGVTVHRLRNGLTVYVAPQPLQPHVAVTVAVRAGSEQERHWAAGLGFLVMMSLHEGTERVGVLDPERERPSRVLQQALLSALGSIHDAGARDTILRAVAASQEGAADLVLPDDLTDAAYALGGRGLNSFRGAGTTLALQLPTHRVEPWLRIVGEAVRAPVFRNMLGVVHQQILRYGEITPGAHASQIIQRELTDATGLLEDYASASEYLMRMPLHDAQAFHDTWYRPNNTAIVFVGDITVEDALKTSENVLGDWAPAALPPHEPVDRPLRAPVTRHEIEDGGAPAVYVAWPLPPTTSPDHVALEALVDALEHHDGLASVLRRKVSAATWTMTAQRSLQVRAVALPGQSLAEVEAETMRALEDIAADRLPDPAWESALARAELTRSGWARTPKALAEVIARSFIERVSWRDVASRLTEPPTRASLVSAAQALLDRDRVVVHKRSGATWHLPLPELPIARVPTRRNRLSPFVRQLVDSPATPPEPRFLVQGSHYDTFPYGGGHVISSELDGPLSFASWIVPVGVDADPWACDAMRARVRAASIPGMDFGAYCTGDTIWVDVVAPAARFEEKAPEVFEWLAHGEPSADDVREHIERALVWRADIRNRAEDRETAFLSWALRGEHGINARLPTDEALARRGPAEIRASLRRLAELPADVLYVGPSIAGLKEWLPPAQGGARPARTPPRVRESDRDLVFVLDDPTREGARVQAFLPRVGLSGRAALAAEIHDEAVVDNASSGPAALDPKWYVGPWWSPDPLAVTAGYACATEDVELAVRTSVELLRREITPAELDDARRRREVSFRAWRPELMRVPETVQLWGGADTDPRAAQWLVLPGLRHEDMRAYYDDAAKRPLIVAIVADARRLDMDAIARFGEVTRVTLDELQTVLRDDRLADGG
jgi:serine/threonine protein kinase/predicted Zn-dependent peptidase